MKTLKKVLIEPVFVEFIPEQLDAVYAVYAAAAYKEKYLQILLNFFKEND